MGCCKRTFPSNQTLLQQAKTVWPSRPVKTSSALPKTDQRTTTSGSSSNPTLLCKYLEQQGGSLKVNVTEAQKIMFLASGSTFDLEENIGLYSCTGQVHTLVQIIRRNLNKLTIPLISNQIMLKDLLAKTIELLKENI